MKHKLVAIIIALSVACMVPTLSSCADHVDDDIAPVFNGLETVRVDCSTENFDMMQGVSAIDKDNNGNETNLTDSIRVTVPFGVTVENGIAHFRQAGDYTFIYSVTDASGNVSTVTRNVEVRNIYNLYWVSATLPVLYCALDMVSNDYKSILIFTRSDTLNIDELSNDRFIYKTNGAWDDEMREAWRMVGRLYNEDSYSYFRLFIVDIYSPSELFSMVRYGIPASRYEVKLLSDGSYTYSSKAFPYRGEDCYKLWQDNKYLYDQAFYKAMIGDFGEKDQWGLDTIRVGDTVIGSTFTDASLDQMGIIAAQRSNVELWCAFPETLKSADVRVQAEIDKANMPKIQPEQIYAALSEQQKDKFLKICNLNKESFDREYFSEDKEYLIVTGTSPVTGALSEDEFIEVIGRIGEDYPNHKILFKPHPVSVPSEKEFVKVYNYFQSNEIKILPGRLPMEVLSWVYSNVHLGGFDSSLFMSVPQGNVDFFIAASKDNLSVLSKQMFEAGAFGNAKFYWKE